MMKGVTFMPNIKLIKAELIKNMNDNIVIRFCIENNNYDLNLQSNDSEEIKKVFLELSKQIRIQPIKIDLSIDKTIDEKKDNLFIDATKEYINQLNDEMLELENDTDLKTIRLFSSNNNDSEKGEENEK